MVEKDMIRAGKLAWSAASQWSLSKRLVMRPEAALQLEKEQPKLLKLKEWMRHIPAFAEMSFLGEIHGAIWSRKAEGDDGRWW
jgi:hypothetical protein